VPSQEATPGLLHLQATALLALVLLLAQVLQALPR
jgi:hypothetical protein